MPKSHQPLDPRSSEDVSELEFRSNAHEIFTLLADRDDVSDDTMLLAAMLQLLVAATSRQTEVMELILGSSDIASVVPMLSPKSH